MNEFKCEVCGKKYYTARLMQDLVEQGEDKCDCGGKLYLNKDPKIGKNIEIKLNKFYVKRK